ncbi:hypothetical protein RHODGE_RHODGE_02091 [Rhodoplanes serenus]|uniref:Uncharacterized protein n=1 Tax=Rhodoplanes serenus TaxID=200615 RepID=A0A3S4B3K2_9BRAD|nr:hypothetical protein [Rhodoplanes serenus]VCU08232.1 hypothetical protein RHODGE_RHODGE_02091 [Rhodoplanes serenus]
MPELIVRVEAVNFSATIDDTNDLSTIRGGGLAALYVAEAVGAVLRQKGFEPRLEFRGASQCAFRITTTTSEDAAAADIEQTIRTALARADGRDAKPPYSAPPHAVMMHVVSVAPIEIPAGTGENAEAEKKALTVAAARGHAQQYRRWTEQPIVFDPAAEDADERDGIRPATATAWFPDDTVDDGEDDGGRGKRRPVSPAVKARREYGRRARQTFYGRELGKSLPPALAGDRPRLRFAQHFQDIVAAPPPEAGLSVRNKIAVVYADGNKFGALRANAGTKVFSDDLDDKRNELLKAITSWLVDGAESREWGDVFKVDSKAGRPPGLRFETLMWGGDEFAFVMPAWLATAFVAGFFRATAGWDIAIADGSRMPLTHAVGVAIGHVKVPIRQLRSIAKEAADAAKAAGLDRTSTATFEIFESLHPPDRDLGRWRKSVFGARADDDVVARHLALPGDGDRFANLMEQIGALRDGAVDQQGRRTKDPFPRSQIYGALRRLREKGIGVGEPGADRAVEEALDRYLAGAGADRGVSREDLDLDEIAGGSPRGLAMTLALLVTLWDYAAPFAPDFPQLAASAGSAS